MSFPVSLTVGQSYKITSTKPLSKQTIVPTSKEPRKTMHCLPTTPTLRSASLCHSPSHTPWHGMLFCFCTPSFSYLLATCPNLRFLSEAYPSVNIPSHPP
ncbi:hypothetical protein [Porphyromonas gingivicanis]|uniref:hypothetical protein n=1 Tax=Porphyromonas gingivicanis TaxID=266762 RepID=UPI0011DD221C|nr:hypothetical protein [Porphyromonas gingivicanis]